MYRDTLTGPVAIERIFGTRLEESTLVCFFLQMTCI